DKTQGEVAEALGVSQVQISRLEAKILDKIRSSF
ncbi:MAG TPA: sigma factor-like helix-turn-helix DNA-binding protein, partial [Eubacteriales bacterium]|nr:sigma factor-like helix-turn-helix DNA-binding protein [Eubacteriales bacterium]